jgi:MFS family permease
MTAMPVAQSHQAPAPETPAVATGLTLPPARFATLAYPDFRWLLFMQFSSNMRMPALFLTQAWYVNVTAPEGQRVVLLGLLAALRGFAFLAYVLFGGTFADRFPRATVLTISHIAGLASVLLVSGLLFIPAVEAGEGIWLWVMLLLFASFGIMTAQDQPTRTAMIRDSVPEPLLSRAATQHQMVMSLALLTAAPLVGLSIERLGFAETYLLAGLGHLAVLFAITRIARMAASDPDASSESVFHNLRQGIAALRQDPVVRWVVFSNWALTALGMSVMGILVPVWLDDILLLDVSGWGLMMLFWGGGGLIASTWLSWRADLRYTGLWFLATAALMGLGVLGFGLSRIIIVAFLFNGLVGLSYQFVLTLSVTIVQRQVPNRLLGRVMGLLLLAGGLMQIAGLIVGLVAQAVGLEVVYPAAGLLMLAYVALLAVRQPPLRHLD